MGLGEQRGVLTDLPAIRHPTSATVAPPLSDEKDRRHEGEEEEGGRGERDGEHGRQRDRSQRGKERRTLSVRAGRDLGKGHGRRDARVAEARLAVDPDLAVHDIVVTGADVDAAQDERRRPHGQQLTGLEARPVARQQRPLDP